MVKNLPAYSGDTRDSGSIPGLERSLGEGNGNPLLYPCLGNPTDRSLAGYSLWHCKESDMTEHTHTHTHTCKTNDKISPYLVETAKLFSLKVKIKSEIPVITVLLLKTLLDISKNA